MNPYEEILKDIEQMPVPNLIWEAMDGFDDSLEKSAKAPPSGDNENEA